jgi:hypothetical protein
MKTRKQYFEIKGIFKKETGHNKSRPEKIKLCILNERNFKHGYN